MKRILTAGLVFLGGAAFAEAPDATDVTKKWEGAKADTKSAAREAGQNLGAATEDQGTFKVGSAYDISGTIKEGGSGEITIVRDGLPPAVLDIRDNTKVYLEGRAIQAKDIPEGSKVRAKFQLEGEESVAVRVDVSQQDLKKTGDKMLKDSKK